MSPFLNNIDLLILLRLLTAHLITDFVLQPAAWVKERKELHAKSIALYKHTILTMLLAYLFLAQWSNWKVPLIIFVTHTLIDIWKSSRSELIRYFIADQLMHITVLVACWLWLISGYTSAVSCIQEALSQTIMWLYFSAYLFVIFPLGFIIGMMVKKFKVQLKTNNKHSSDALIADETLADAGRWIGIFERILILTFVLTNQFGAIGFLIAAKSILRFNNKDEESARKETEYVLVGTLISYAFSILTGLITIWFISNL